MGKLQPNFSWQKYEGKAEDQKEQFQYQLQSQHIQVSNSVNSTIDDESFFTRERMTSFTWIDGRPIWKKTFTKTLTILGANIILHGIVGLMRVLQLYGMAQNAIPMTTFALPLPFVDADPGSFVNQIKLYATPTTIVIDLDAASPWQNYLAEVTIFYTKF